MAINHETTMRVPLYLKKDLVVKIDEEAMQRNIPRNQMASLIFGAYFLDVETHEAEEVKENEEK